ncbi:MAG TPA: hypothetical protein VF603_16295 [Allosphingosinicella sp.]|jgi:hypothetical protein
MLLAAIAAAAATQPASAVPTTAPAAEQAPQLVAIPFAPPLGQPLRYRLVRETTRGGRPQRTEAMFLVSFRRSGGDYVMSVRLELPPGVPPPSASSAMSLIFSRPTEFRLTPAGEIVEMLDMEAHWAAGERAVAEMTGQRAIDPSARQAVAGMIARIRALPPEAQLELFARNVAPIVAAAGVELAVGEELRESGMAHSILGSLMQNATVRLDGVDGRVARLSGRSTVSSEELEAATRELMARLAPSRQDALGFRIVSNELTEAYEVSLETGLTERYRTEKIVVTEANGTTGRATEVQTLERVPALR